MKPTIAGIAASAAAASTIFLAVQEGNKGNGGEVQRGQMTWAEIETELKAMDVFNEAKTDDEGTQFFDLTIEGVNVQFFAMPASNGAPQYWRISAGWDLASSPRPDDVNKFNMASKQAFSYLDNQYDPFLVVDQNVTAGSSAEVLRAVVESYRQAVPAFKAIVLRNRA